MSTHAEEDMKPKSLKDIKYGKYVKTMVFNGLTLTLRGAKWESKDLPSLANALNLTMKSDLVDYCVGDGGQEAYLFNKAIEDLEPDEVDHGPGPPEQDFEIVY